jgi:hypothetical protein
MLVLVPLTPVQLMSLAPDFTSFTLDPLRFAPVIATDTLVEPVGWVWGDIAVILGKVLEFETTRFTESDPFGLSATGEYGVLETK